jgi:hypothetical protein
VADSAGNKGAGLMILRVEQGTEDNQAAHATHCVAGYL